jgi:nitrate reductase (NAD(P)H)
LTYPAIPNPFTDSENAKAMMPTYHIGTLAPTTKPLLSQEEEHSTSSSTVFLSPKTWRRALITHKTDISPNTKIFTFTLPAPTQSLGLPVGQHLMIRLRDPVTREAIIRAYTPLPSEDSPADGATEPEASDTTTALTTTTTPPATPPPPSATQLRVLIKIYRDTPHQKGGKMTQALDSLPLGHPVEFKGPVGKFEYLGHGRCRTNGRERTVRKFVMVCGGSGVTPIFAVLQAVVDEMKEGREGGPECVVLDGNQGVEDILLRGELEGLVGRGGGRCRVVHTLSRAPPMWEGGRGRMDRGLFEREVGAPSGEGDAMVLVCGPEGMERATREAFLGMGWAEEDLLFF